MGSTVSLPRFMSLWSPSMGPCLEIGPSQISEVISNLLRIWRQDHPGFGMALNPMTGVLTRRGDSERRMGRRRRRLEGCRQPGVPGASESWGRPGGILSRSAEGARSCQICECRLLASTAVRQCISVVSSLGCSPWLGGPQETQAGPGPLTPSSVPISTEP